MHVVIIGASRGIGAGLASEYRAAGHEVTATGRSDAALAPLDVRDPDSISAFAQTIRTPIDLLICNAGIFPDAGQPLTDGYPPQMWADVFATNVTGVFLSVQALLPQMAKGSKIAIISSQMGSQTIASGGSYIYRASKAAVLNLGRNLAVDLAPRGIAVGIYHPGWVQTDMGGARADIDVATSVAGLRARFEHLSPETTGCFETWDGRAHPF